MFGIHLDPYEPTHTATQGEAHSEWHANAEPGVSCPWDCLQSDTLPPEYCDACFWPAVEWTCLDPEHGDTITHYACRCFGTD